MRFFVCIFCSIIFLGVEKSYSQGDRFYFKENEKLITSKQKRIQTVLDSVSGAYEQFVRKEGTINDVTLKMYNSQQKLQTETRIGFYKHYLIALDSLANANYIHALSISKEPLTQSQKKLSDLEASQNELITFVGKIREQEQTALQEIVYDEKGYKKFVRKLRKKDGLDAVIAFNTKCYRLLGNNDLPHLKRYSSLALAEKFKDNCEMHQKVRRDMYLEQNLKNWAFKKIFKIEKYAFNGKKRQKLSKKYNKKIAKLPYVQKAVAIEKADQLKFFMEVYAKIYNGEDYEALKDVVETGLK